MITRSDDDDRGNDRYVLAYALSIFIHFFILALFAVHVLMPTESGAQAPETETVAVTAQRATISSAAPSTPPPVTAPPQTPSPQSTPPPRTPPPQTPPPKRVPPRHVVAHPRVVRQAPEKSDLAVIVHNGTPAPEHITIVAPEITLPPTSQPSPQPLPVRVQAVATIAPTLPPIRVTPQPETPKPQTPQPTVPPTVKPTIVPTVAPTIPPPVPTVRPTVAPTVVPTAAPTVRPTVAATVRPTVAPTARATTAPTVAPTVAATARPTAAPTARPTSAPTAARPTVAPVTAAPATAAPAAVARVNPAPAATAGRALASAKPNALVSAAGAKGSATSGSGASSASGGAAGGAAGSAAGTQKGAVAYTNPGAASPAASNNGDSSLNRRLNALLPSGPVAYSNKEYVGDLNAAVDQAKAAAYAAVAPPQSVLDRAIAVVRQRGVLLDSSSSIVYIIKRQKIFGFNICTGWKISYPAGGGPPEGGYTVGPCSGEAFAPSGGLPTLPPKAAPSP